MIYQFEINLQKHERLCSQCGRESSNYVVIYRNVCQPSDKDIVEKRGYCLAHFDRCGWSQVLCHLGSFLTKNGTEHRFKEIS